MTVKTGTAGANWNQIDTDTFNRMGLGCEGLNVAGQPGFAADNLHALDDYQPQNALGLEPRIM